MNQDEAFLETLKAEKIFLESQLRKLNEIIRSQEEQIADLRMANQDLKFQLIQKQEIDELDDGRC
jgi:SMC interacting uncharacterized protein involved in chromosome segregation